MDIEIEFTTDELILLSSSIGAILYGELDKFNTFTDMSDEDRETMKSLLQRIDRAWINHNPNNPNVQVNRIKSSEK